MGTAPGNAVGLTDEQRDSLVTRGVSIALSAGAGCGKTFVLTERFLTEIAPDARAVRADLSEVVAITFTERAAREMRDRIRRKTHERLLVAKDHAEADYWLAIERQLDGARVSTIHSFCVALLRSQAIEAGLDPRFAVLDEKQTRALQNALVEDQLRILLSARHPPAMELVFHVGLQSAQEFLRQLLVERQTLQPAESWRGITADSLLSRWHEYFVSTYRPAKLREFTQHASWRTVEDMVRGNRPSHPLLLERCEQLVEALDRLPTSAEIVPLLMEIRESARVQGVKQEKETSWNGQEFDRFRDAAESLRKRISDSVKERNAWEFSPAGARYSAELGVHLLALAESVIAAYDAAKREAAVLDFEDLLILARDLLCGEDRRPLRRRVAEQIRLLLVDEFQDTDPVQVELVRALCDAALVDGKLFFVGDLKQSIYRFRGAQPEVFHALRESMPKAGRLPLTRNFRSQPEILAFVNALFHDELGPGYEPLVPDRPQVTPAPAVEFLWVSGNSDEEEDSPRQPGKAQEAEWMARRLRAMLDVGDPLVFERNEDGRPAARAARPGDIAILLRAMTHVEIYEAALRKYGIEHYVVGGHAFYAQQEVFDLVNLLRALISRADDLSLAGALRSPFFSLADETLFWLAHDPDGLQAGLFGGAGLDALATEERRKVTFAAATMETLRARKDRLPIAGIIQEALRLTGYDAVLTAEFLGERKLANLHKLLDQARSMDAAGIFTLGDYVEQLSQFTRQQPKEPPAAMLAEDANVVRLMSIHQSKGLEFPIVVVPDLNAKHQGSPASFAFDPRLGPLVRARRDSGLVGLEMHRVVNHEADRAERSRLLYVATTRAADYLMLSSSIENITAPTGPWLELLARRFDLETGELKAALPDGYDRPQVRVTMSEPACARPEAERRTRPDWTSILTALPRQPAPGDVAMIKRIEIVPVDHAARRHFSFSRLSGEMEQERAEHSPISELEPAASSDALALGHLVHAVIEQLDFDARDRSGALVDALAPQFLAPGAREVPAAKELLERFCASDVADALAAARTLHRELPFSLRWPLEAAPEDAVVIDGVIDCLYEDRAGDWRLVDFKTNRVAADGVARLAQRYEPQLWLYALAVEHALGAAPKSATLHFLQPGVAHSFTWNDAATSRLSTIIDAAIKRLQGAC